MTCTRRGTRCLPGGRLCGEGSLHTGPSRGAHCREGGSRRRVSSDPSPDSQRQSRIKKTTPLPVQKLGPLSSPVRRLTQRTDTAILSEKGRAPDCTAQGAERPTRRGCCPHPSLGTGREAKRQGPGRGSAHPKQARPEAGDRQVQKPTKWLVGLKITSEKSGSRAERRKAQK